MSEQTQTLAQATPAIALPKDQYAHAGAPTEWWWHVGTLETSDGHIFGFEVNACGASSGTNSLVFTEVAIADIQNKKHYQIVNNHIDYREKWAEDDPAQPWFVFIPGQGTPANNGAVSMTAINGNPLNMAVQATFVDAASGTRCAINLNLIQHGPPLLVWGTGKEQINPGQTPPEYNYYYSLTNLHASGTITIGEAMYNVTGVTWMDHEYGAFPSPRTGGSNIWTLQDMQLSNGLHFSNYTEFQVVPREGVAMNSNITVLLQNGESITIPSATTPLAPITIGGSTYFSKFKVELYTNLFNNALTTIFMVETLLDDQVFKDPLNLNNGYEGVAKCEMILLVEAGEGKTVEERVPGTAWIEQSLGYTS